MNLGELVKNAIVPLISVVTALMVAWLNYSLSERDQAIQAELSKINAQVALDKEEREERESNQQFNLKIYEIVTESLEEKNAKKQEAAQAFVVVMVEEPLRSSLLNVLKQGGDPEVRKNIGQILEAEKKFKEAVDTQAQLSVSPDTQGTVSPSYQWGDWDFDIFWCAGSGDTARQQADLIGKQLIAEGSRGRIRVRELPDSINAKAGYQISGYVIRRNSNKQETEAAGALKEMAESVLDKNGVTATFSLGISYQDTPWYVSAFVCPQIR